MSTSILLVGKDGRCLRLTTYHFQVPMSGNLDALTSQNHLGPIACKWNTLPVILTMLETSNNANYDGLIL
jgi:hypothetical protein